MVDLTTRQGEADPCPYISALKINPISIVVLFGALTLLLIMPRPLLYNQRLHPATENDPTFTPSPLLNTTLLLH